MFKHNININEKDLNVKEPNESLFIIKINYSHDEIGTWEYKFLAEYLISCLYFVFK